jgi:RNA polymerase sigma-70 factor (ECF subfamily)
MHVDENRKLNDEFGKFFVENYPRVKAFARQILMSEQDAEDLAQDVFLKMMDRPEIWQDDERKDGYLYRATKNHILNFIKRRNVERRYRENLALHDRLDETFSLEDRLHVKEMKLIIMYAVERLPERRKEIFKMSRYAGKTNREIADALQMSVRTVERHIYLALANIKNMLNNQLPVA